MTELTHTSSRDVRTAVQTALAFFRRDFLVAVSYKSAFLADVLGILFKVVTFYYIGALFGGAISPSLAAYDHDYFAFLIIGIALVDFVHTSLQTFSVSIRESQMAGTLEVVLLSPIRVKQMVLYSSLWPFFFTGIRFGIYLVFGAALFGLDIDPNGLWAGLVVLLLTILCFAPLGIISAALIMVFKKGTWFQAMVSGTSFLLGGVAYPVDVLPEWAVPLSYFVPLTHSVNAIRQALLNGQGLEAPEVLGDVVFLAVFASVLTPIALWIFERGVNRTRKLGTLTQLLARRWRRVETDPDSGATVAGNATVMRETMRSARRVSLILPVKDDADAVAPTLESILAQTRWPDEIVVGDQHSADDTVARILAYERSGIPIRIEQARGVGAAAGRNAAIAAARYEIIAAADFGNVLDEAWLEEIVKPFEHDATVDLAAGVALPDEAENGFQRYASAVMYPAGRPEARPGTWRRTQALAGGASMAFRKETWRRVGGFPEWIRTAEDKLFSRKVHRSGGTVVGVPGAVVYKGQRSTLTTFLRQQYRYGRGNAQSRQVSRNTWRLFLQYLGGGMLLLAGAVTPWAWVALLVGAIRRTYRWALRPYVARYGAAPSALVTVAGVLLSRDVAWLGGHLVGYVDWLCRPTYREHYAGYMSGPGSSSV